MRKQVLYKEERELEDWVRLFISGLYLSLLSFSLSGDIFAEEGATQGLGQLQRQIISTIQAAQSGAQAETVLDLIRQKFMVSNGTSLWSLNPYPTPAEISTAKPRIRVNTPLAPSRDSVVPRWEIRQKQNNGACTNLPAPVTSKVANLVSSDCPTSAVEFLPDSSALASIERNPAPGSEQRGFIVFLNSANLSEDEKTRLYSDPGFLVSSTSAALQAVPIKFMGYVGDPSAPQNIRIKIAVGEAMGEVPLPPPMPSCTLTATRNTDSSNTCTVTVTSSGITTGALLTSHPATTLLNSGDTWANSSVSCPSSSATTFIGSVTGPGSGQRVACSNSVTVQPLPPDCNFSVARIPGSPTSCRLSVNSTGSAPAPSYPRVFRQQGGSVLDVQRPVPLVNGSGFLDLTCHPDFDTHFSVVIQDANPRIMCSGGDMNGIITIPSSTCFASASGGEESVVSAGTERYRVHQFKTVGSSSFTVSKSCPMEVLVVAGGGGGGSGRAAGGGGAGGLFYSNSYSLEEGKTHAVVVGAGGGVNSPGLNSVLGPITAIGGGRGGRGEGANGPQQTGGAGGSGGGGGFKGNFGAGTGTPGQGRSGGRNRNGNWIGGGGGGGFGSAGKQAGTWASVRCGGLPSCGEGGVGGSGLNSAISGTSLNYAGGGGGCGEQRQSDPNGFGGGRGGRDGVAGTRGLANTGGGGGGCGGTGGSGIVIIRYRIRN